MQERAAAAGAAFVLHSAPGEGTHIFLDWLEPPVTPAISPAAASLGTNGANPEGERDLREGLRADQGRSHLLP
jgi:hypothetical protein